MGGLGFACGVALLTVLQSSSGALESPVAGLSSESFDLARLLEGVPRDPQSSYRGRRAPDRSAAHAQPPAAGDRFRVVIADVSTRDAARKAVRAAAEWLRAPRCTTVFSEFLDRRGRPLSDKLDELGVTGEAYLGLVVFLDDPLSGHCANHGTLAFTTCGSRVVYLCGREFERAWRRDAAQAQAAIIHEVLHSLGLGENPPSPRHISHRVMALCWP
jgi:hypothetical protein